MGERSENDRQADRMVNDQWARGSKETRDAESVSSAHASDAGERGEHHTEPSGHERGMRPAPSANRDELKGDGIQKHAIERLRAQADMPILYVPLDEIGDPALVVPTIARTLGIRPELGLPLIETLARVWSQYAFVLALDNFEHVLAAASQLTRLLGLHAGLKLLLTSRAPLGVRGEQFFQWNLFPYRRQRPHAPLPLFLHSRHWRVFQQSPSLCNLSRRGSRPFG